MVKFHKILIQMQYFQANTKKASMISYHYTEKRTFQNPNKSIASYSVLFIPEKALKEEHKFKLVKLQLKLLLYFKHFTFHKFIMYFWKLPNEISIYFVLTKQTSSNVAFIWMTLFSSVISIRIVLSRPWSTKIHR